MIIPIVAEMYAVYDEDNDNALVDLFTDPIIAEQYAEMYDYAVKRVLMNGVLQMKEVGVETNKRDRKMMLHDYQREELRVQAERAKQHLESNCPLLEDEVAVAVWEYILELEKKLKLTKETSLRRGIFKRTSRLR